MLPQGMGSSSAVSVLAQVTVGHAQKVLTPQLSRPQEKCLVSFCLSIICLCPPWLPWHLQLPMSLVWEKGGEGGLSGAWAGFTASCASDQEG